MRRREEQGGSPEADFLAPDASDVLSQGYGMAPKVVARDERLSLAAKGIYLYLASFAGAGMSAYPSKETILRELGISKPTFEKHVKQLQMYGYLRVTQRKSADNRFTTNLYELSRAPKTNDESLRRYAEARARQAAKDRARYEQRRRGSAGAGSLSHDEMAEAIAAALSEKIASDLAAASGGKPVAAGSPAVESFPWARNLATGASWDFSPWASFFTTESVGKFPYRGPWASFFTTANTVNSNNGGIESINPSINTPPDSPAHARDGDGPPPSGAGDEAFDLLCADSIKPVRPGDRPHCREAFDALVAKGHPPESISEAYAHYRRRYVAENRGTRYALQLRDWLTKGHGFALDWQMLHEGQAADMATRERAEAIRRAGGDAALADALARVDPEFERIRDEAREARERRAERARPGVDEFRYFQSHRERAEQLARDRIYEEERYVRPCTPEEAKDALAEADPEYARIRAAAREVVVSGDDCAEKIDREAVYLIAHRERAVAALLEGHRNEGKD